MTDVSHLFEGGRLESRNYIFQAFQAEAAKELLEEISKKEILKL